MTVTLTVANRVLYKFALVPMKQYPFFLAQFITFGIVTDEMIALPKWRFMVIGVLMALGVASGMASAAMLSGQASPILNQLAIPHFDGHYDHWNMLMETFLRSKDYWTVVESGIAKPIAGITKQIWDSMKKKYQGSARTKRQQLQALHSEFEILQMTEGESVTDYFSRTMAIVNKLRIVGDMTQDIVVVEKMLQSMTPKFNYIVCSIKESHDIDALTIDDLQSSLLVHKRKLNRQEQNEQALKATIGTSSSFSDRSNRGRGRGRAREETNRNLWYLDTGCSNHMCGDKAAFSALDESFRDKVKFGDNSKTNLLSIGQLQEKGYEIIIKNGVCRIQDSKLGLIAQVKMTANRMFPLHLNCASQSCFSAKTNEVAWLWHSCYGHLSFGGLKQLHQKNMVTGMPVFESPSNVCEECVVSKQHCDPFPKGRSTRARSLLEIVHSDICRPINPISNGDEKRKKLDDKGGKSIFLGVSNHSKAYKLYNPNTKKIIISRDVIFDEGKFWEWDGGKVEKKIPVVFYAFIPEAELDDGQRPSVLEKGLHGCLIMRKAMDEEIEAIERNNSWELTTLPEVAKGYKQEFGVDYQEVFALVARHDTIKLVISLATQNSWPVFQLDVKLAFLHGDLDEQVFIEQPPGYVKVGNEHKVYKLKRALYGLKQAPQAWYSRIEAYFLKEGFQKCPYEHTLFTKTKGGKMLIVCLYVDDLIYTGNDKAMFDKFKKSMMVEFDMSDLGLMHYYLGIEVDQSTVGIFVSQKKYVQDILDRFRMKDCNLVSTPIDAGMKLVRNLEAKKVNSTLYKQMVGSLMYLTATRPDIMHVVSLISRYMESPKEMHLLVAKRILRYLKGTAKYGLFYKNGEKSDMFGFADSDFARDLDDRKSTSGYVFMMGTKTVSWSSRKQPIVTLSTTEAEFVAATSCACQAIWLRRILKECHFK
ncbi:hypothetical protein SLEP1_g15614 [Rubroshorea leprosula]|uniref:Retrovirus-related Pol polyprotein from transposon RE1 n=1 Tax=Rubroshorea leprosula TaxID=152421 RepID=A0AAV5IX43_9ROSI|nr:hypothetical protein SLEP1_g15614 [Rubroshorea leprosula]